MRTPPVILIATSLVLACGCRQPEVETKKPAPIDLSLVRKGHESLRKATKRRFERGAFLSPSDDSDVGELIWMAPLAVQELGKEKDEMEASVRPGALVVDPSGQAVVDTEQLTVYLISSRVQLGQQRFDQLTYLWFYLPESTDGRIGWRGCRIILSKQRFGVVWEVLSSEATQRVFYVPKSLEKASEKEHGPPLAGRHHAVEPALEDHPDVIVARVVGDGPQPMGPFVYLDQSLAVTTMMCRCDPSQVDAFPQSVNYRLTPIDSMGDLYKGDTPPPNLRLPDPSDDLSTILRLPSEL